MKFVTHVINGFMVFFGVLYSPVRMKVLPKVEPGKVKVYGNGVSSKGIPASIPVDFTVDASEAGVGDLEIQVLVSEKIIFLYHN